VTGMDRWVSAGRRAGLNYGQECVAPANSGDERHTPANYSDERHTPANYGVLASKES
jgi:hypothetical protein